jgi:hypothetical protein
MKSKTMFWLGLCALICLNSGLVLAQEAQVETIKKGCETELAAYCKNVTPGDGRVLACLYAYGDKLSGKCEFALYDAAVQLERGVSSLSYVANECARDLDTLCSSVAMGDGRLLECLNKNKAKIHPRCKEALMEIIEE